jgi:predicted transcriptional regulator
MDKTIIHRLLDHGFSKNEAHVYVSSIRLGRARASRILEDTGLPRSVVYLELDSLIRRGLVQKSKERGVTVFTALDSSHLIDEFQAKKHDLEDIAEELNNLEALREREVVVYEGVDIVKKVADKCLATPAGSTIYFLGPSKFGVQSKLERYWQRFHTERASAGIQCRLLYDISTDPDILLDRNAMPLCEARYMPINSELPMSYIFTETVVGQILPAEDPPLAFTIKSTSSALAMKQYFEYLWAQSEEFIA